MSVHAIILINAALQTEVQHFLRNASPLLMMDLIMDQIADSGKYLSEEQMAELTACHRLMSAFAKEQAA